MRENNYFLNKANVDQQQPISPPIDQPQPSQALASIIHNMVHLSNQSA